MSNHFYPQNVPFTGTTTDFMFKYTTQISLQVYRICIHLQVPVMTHDRITHETCNIIDFMSGNDVTIGDEFRCMHLTLISNCHTFNKFKPKILQFLS